MTDDKIKVGVEFVTDKASAKQAADAVGNIKLSAGGIGSSLSELKSGFAEASVSIAAVIAPLMAMSIAIYSAADNWVKFAGNSDKTSNQWLQSNLEIEDSYRRIGKIAAREILPFQQKAADLTKQAADFLDKNPWIASALISGAAGKVAQGLGVLPSGGQTSPFGSASNNQASAYLSYSRGESESQISHFQQLAAQERSFDRQMEVAHMDYQHQVLMSERQFYQQREMGALQFAYSQQKAANDYNYSVMVSNRSYYRDRLKEESDFQRQMKWMNVDHDYNMAMAAINHDAMAMTQEQHSYDVGKARAQDDFDYQKMWANQQHQWQLQDQQEAFNRSRQITINDYNFNLNIQQKQFDFTKKMAEDEFKYSQQKAKEQFQWQKNENEIQYGQERDARRRALIYTLTDLQEGLTAEQRLRNQFTQAMLSDLRGAVNQAQDGSLLPFSGASAGAGTSINNATFNMGNSSTSTTGGDWMQPFFDVLTRALRGY